MLLLALARVGLGPERRLIRYETADKRFKELWREFGRPGTPPRVYYPFGRLRNDDRLWEIPEELRLSTGQEADILVSEAKRFEITAGFRPDRFVGGPPKAAELPAEVWINRVLPVTPADGAEPANGGKEDH